MEISIRTADLEMGDQIIAKYGDWISRHGVLHFEAGSLSLAAIAGGEPVGFLSVYTVALPPPLASVYDAYIDVIEVDEAFRRQGIARRMLLEAEMWARARGLCQMRAWSNNQKSEAIPMWRALGYSLCPARIWVEWCGEVVDGFYAVKRL